MSRVRNPEYDRRDLMFVHACEKCARANRCMFKTSPEGPEEVCDQLVNGGTYHCESCIRHRIGGQCHFKCVFFREKVEEAPEKRDVKPMTPEAQSRWRNRVDSFVGTHQARNYREHDQPLSDR